MLSGDQFADRPVGPDYAEIRRVEEMKRQKKVEILYHVGPGLSGKVVHFATTDPRTGPFADLRENRTS